jgi:hypothetical protein
MVGRITVSPNHGQKTTLHFQLEKTGAEKKVLAAIIDHQYEERGKALSEVMERTAVVGRMEEKLKVYKNKGAFHDQTDERRD